MSETKEEPINGWGVRFINKEDFSNWGWDNCGPKKAARCGNVILEEIKGSAWLYLETDEPQVTVVADMFEGKTMLKISLLTMVRDWIIERAEYGTMAVREPEYRVAAHRIQNDLRLACALLENSLADKEE